MKDDIVHVKVRILNCDDWQGLYIDDQLQWEEHQIHQDDLIKSILDIEGRVDYKSVWIESLEGYDYRCPEHWKPEFTLADINQNN